MSPWANFQETSDFVQNAGTQLTASRLNALHEITRVKSARGSIISKRVVGSTTRQQPHEVKVQPQNIINQARIDLKWNSVHLTGTLRRRLGWITISAEMFVSCQNEQQVHNTCSAGVATETLDEILITRNYCWNTFKSCYTVVNDFVTKSRNP